MGTCWNCLSQVTLKEEETKCDNCGKNINYQCNYCHKWFSIYDEKEEKKINECKVCGFFVCPNCGTCSPSCLKEIWQANIMKILAPEITYVTFPSLQNKINKILSYIEEIKIDKDRRTCPRGVPISYAKERIKRFIVRTRGFKTKNDLDVIKFKERIEEILNKDLGSQLTINQSREEGSYGQEYRDAFNYCLCLGKLKIQKVEKEIDGELVEFYVYRRVEDGICPLLNLTDLIIKICPNPKCKIHKFPLDSEYCSSCIYQKGKNKGQAIKLKLKISNKDICNLNRGEFEKKDGRSKNMGND